MKSEPSPRLLWEMMRLDEQFKRYKREMQKHYGNTGRLPSIVIPPEPRPRPRAVTRIYAVPVASGTNNLIRFA